jgi:hypothetical protein
VLLAGGADPSLRREAGPGVGADSREKESGGAQAALAASLLFGRIAGLVASAGAEPGKTPLEVAVGEAVEVLSEAAGRARARGEQAARAARFAEEKARKEAERAAAVAAAEAEDRAAREAAEEEERAV